MVVAMALAQSLNPLKKSYTRAATIIARSRIKSDSFYNHRFNGIGDIFAVIRCGLQAPVDLLPFDGHPPVRLLIQKLTYHLLRDLISFIFQAIDLYAESG